ncbi:beta-ketoacyl-[acyl-carrier-protein] synthase family protein [Klebsiella aerogenes]|uniref:beta-ketoacyl-[acyl-carrier-protein] synthase family protein n=1 Tax=Klebsiella aerogenes TaxID=548 RepID=UPI000907E123|nr:beta-ketoacyl-[acyl-carrier-protein] synthase family protein [Klebsiella aerogenes]EIW8606166.1 beta-ketoacyl-[acyl-carrier-protein] synthase family protein [Klebsiella aerogenes]MBS7084522.1 beta-ketoacyl-[acyl-carrier-protein] synthase family protein [Klebsiella aerogenes]RSW98385.1 beta-ketoacyl-ACP synthase [Klebsiella aerogenes]HDN2627806.1 beta-ketoacyl-[acyl-carrier-protein] synthase family protein [Klebsiella aerogenes]HDN2632839.1 beta-ketoacyl-[acyl-carrier-protein] synthase famil
MKTSRKRVVITGMGILSSLADNITDFRQALLEKKNGITDSARFSKWFENARAAEMLHEIHCPELSEEIVSSLDNAALWAYKVGKEALNQADLFSNQQCLEQMGLIVGVSSAGTEAFLPLFEQRVDDFSLRKALFSGGFSSCCSSASTLLGLKGGVELVATACTASPNAVGMAFDYIQNGKSKAMLAIGTEPIYLPTFAGFYALNVMHPQSCSPFSGQSGMSIGEGAGAVVLEEYEHAVARGATIFGEILSYATSCDAYHETGPDPRANGAVQVMQKAMANAGVQPEHIDYVNAHGTGTEANDQIETLAMKKVFSGAENLLISSTKSYFGHNIGAAGIVELIACLVTLPEQNVLPTLNFSLARPNCDLDYVANAFREKDINIFMKNNYAFGGNNCCMIVSTKPGSVPLTSYDAKRVAITGIGAVSAIGHSINEILHYIHEADSPVELSGVVFPDDTLEEANALLDVLATTNQLTEIFGPEYQKETYQQPEDEKNFKTYQVKDLEPRKHLRRYDPRKATRGGTFALIALTETLNMAKRKIKRDGNDLGMVLGMARGPQETTYKYLQSLKPDPRKVRTSEFPGSLMNSITTFCGISEGIKGYTTTLATGENAALGALTYGYEIVRQQLQPQVIVGGADEYFPSMSLYMDAVTNKIHMTSDASDYQIYAKEANGYVPGEGACMLLLEDPQAAVSRGAEVLAEIAGYGKSCSNSYFDITQVEEKSAAMSLAITRALVDAGITSKDIDLVCGTSNGSEVNSLIEMNAIYMSFNCHNPRVPVVNYNAFFGLVASVAGLLNLSVILDCIKKQSVPAIPYTQAFADKRINFVHKPLNLNIKYALLIGATEGGNYYAIVIKG